MNIIDVQPDVGLPNIKVRTPKKRAKMMATANVKNPIIEAIAKGISENATIPSNEYLNNDQNDQVV